MNSVVRPFGSGDQKLRIEDPFLTIFDVLGSERVNMVNQQLNFDLVTWDAQIAAVVAQDDLLPSMPPFARFVESLIEPPVEAKRGLPDLPTKLEIVVTFLKRFKPSQLTVRPTPHRDRRLLVAQHRNTNA